MLLTEKVKLVDLFVENLLRGSITIKGEKYKRENLQELYDGVSVLSAFKNERELTLDDDKKLTKAIHNLYHYYVEGKVRGVITGKLYDADLEEEITNAKERIRELESKNSELRSNNIDLANELNDRKNIIDSYEHGSYKRE